MTEADNSTVPQKRCCGHRRSSSLPVGPINAGPSTNGEATGDDTKQDGEKNFVDLSGLVDTLNQISESIARPAKCLVEFLDRKNGKVDKTTQKIKHEDASDGLNADERVQTALKQINIIQANLKHILPHMEEILTDYKTTKERSQSRDEMIKTLDKALRRSEGQGRTFLSQLQDMRDENKCLKEKAQQNESILRYLEKGREETCGEKRNKPEKEKEDGGSKRVNRTRGVGFGKAKSHSVGDIRRAGKITDLARSVGNIAELGGEETPQGQTPGEETPGGKPAAGNEDLGAKLGHYQKVLLDNESQLQEVMQLNKELVLKLNVRESEVMNINRELLKHQETLAIYEKGFKNLTKGNSEMDAVLREEKAKNVELREKLDDSEGYINCITDKVASYEVELKYLRQKLRSPDAEKEM